MRPVLILGGYGTFGGRISRALVDRGINIVIAGRHRDPAIALQQSLPQGASEVEIFDVASGIDRALERLKPSVVVHTAGPFQDADYGVAESCIRHGVHYIDLSDGRDFVGGIGALDGSAKSAGVAVIGGASTVPALSSAVLDEYAPRFSRIDRVRLGISPGQQADRGLATTRGVLSYVGRKLRDGADRPGARYGWQDLYRQRYPVLGSRWMSNIDIPDIDLLPPKYGIGALQCSAGFEIALVHFGLSAMSRLRRWGVPLPLERLARPLLAFSHLFDRLGSADGGMHVVVRGLGPERAPYTVEWFVIARDGDGPHIPTIPAIVLTERLLKGDLDLIGAVPCVGLVSLESYLGALSPYRVETFVNETAE